MLLNLRSVSCKEVVTCLLRREFADWWKDTKRVASQHDDIARLTIDRAWNLRIRDELNRICTTSILRDADVVVVRYARLEVIDDVLEDTAKADGVEDLGLLLGRKVDALGVAATLNVEHSRIRPDVLIITNKQSVRVGRQGSLACAREPKEQRDIVLLDTHIGGRVERQLTEFDGLQVMLCDAMTSVCLVTRNPVTQKRLTITEKTPFFISPAYSVPSMTISIRLKLISTDVVDDMPLVNRLAGNCPAL